MKEVGKPSRWWGPSKRRGIADRVLVFPHPVRKSVRRAATAVAGQGVASQKEKPRLAP